MSVWPVKKSLQSGGQWGYIGKGLFELTIIDTYIDALTHLI
jgi:hypothetical protein